MRIMVIGVGEEGEAFISDLLKFYENEISLMVLADRREQRLNQLVQAIGNKKLSTMPLDIFDHKKLVQAMQDVDLVINYVGPFYRMGNRVLKAAIEAKKHYFDIDDDTESTLIKLDLDEQARAAGITAVIGMGAAPGATNLIAKHAAEKLDRTDEINIYWVANIRSTQASRFVPPAAARHIYNGIRKAGPQFIDGKVVNVPPLSGATYVDFNQPIGKAEVVYFGHPEAITIPRYIKGLKKSTNRGGLLPSFRMEHVRQAHNLGFTRDEPIEIGGNSISPIDFITALDNIYVPDECLGEPVSAIRIEVKGWKEDKPKEIIFNGSSSGMAAATAAPASIGIHMFIKGEITKKGVYAPEGCIDNYKEFMTELAKRSL